MKPETLLRCAHQMMGVCLLFSLGIIYLLYGIRPDISLRAQVGLHIGLVIFPAFFKIGYIVRLTALKQLGRVAN